MLRGDNQKAKDFFLLKPFASFVLMTAVPSRPRDDKVKGKKQDEDKEGSDDDDEDFKEPLKEVNFIFGGPDTYESKRKQKLAFREVNAVAPAPPEYMRWFDANYF